jgi:SAM-dependent methyltransferase
VIDAAADDAERVRGALTALGARDAERVTAAVAAGELAFGDAVAAVAGHPEQDVPESIRMLYRALLGREADLPGLASHQEAIASGRAGLADVVQSILVSTEFAGSTLGAALARVAAVAAVPTLYARPRHVESIDTCHFYHAMDLPGIGVVGGEWDLRPGIGDYLGDVDVHGRRVLDVGAASGFVSFELERRGAEVVAYDLPADGPWDVVPQARADLDRYAAERRHLLRRLRNGFWFAHRRLGSSVRLIEGRADQIPVEAGRFDVAVVSSILMHLRDPVRALQAIAGVTDGAIVVAEPSVIDAHEPLLLFRPARETLLDTWWAFTPAAIAGMLAMLGFADTRVYHHRQRTGDGGEAPYFTVVGRRPAG